MILRSASAYRSRSSSQTFYLLSTFIANNFLSDLRSTKNTSPNDPAPKSWWATKSSGPTLYLICVYTSKPIVGLDDREESDFSSLLSLIVLLIGLWGLGDLRILLSSLTPSFIYFAVKPSLFFVFLILLQNGKTKSHIS